jgi:hypothetical protein
VKAFFCVVVDRCPKGLEITPRATLVAAMFGVSRASVGIDLGQHLAAPEFVKAADPGIYLELVGRLTDVREVDRQNIGAVDVVDVAMAALRSIFSADILG